MKAFHRIRHFRFWVLGLATPVTLALDQWTKHLIHSRFRWGESQVVIQDWFSLTYVRNTGAAFGFLNRAPAYFREPFFILVPVVALFILLYLLIKLHDAKRWTATAFTLILSGALGNLIDRLRFGFVIDFLDFHYKEAFHYPAFNVADSCIVVGVGILFSVSIAQDRAVARAKQAVSTKKA